MRDYPKQVKRSLRQLAAVAHEREVRRHLEQLAADFSGWQAGVLDTWELSDRIHRFHDGPNRQLFNFYTGNQPDMAVAYAVVAGILLESEVPPEVARAIANLIGFYRHDFEVVDSEESDPGQRATASDGRPPLFA